MKKKALLAILSVLMLLIMACSVGGADASQLEATKMSISIQQTQNAFIKMTLSAATEQQNAAPVVEPIATADFAATQTALAAPQEQEQVPPTAEPVTESSPTIEVEGNHFDQIKEYVRADDADYYSSADVNMAWNDKDEFWYQTLTEEADNYVLSATVNWTAPADMGDPARNGCGFIYGMSDPKHFHVTVVSPDQKVHTYRKRSAEEIEMKGGDVPGGGLGIASGQAELMLTVENKTMTAYVNGTQIVMFNDPYIDYGQMGLAIDAATYSGFTCSFSDVKVWILK